MAKDLTINIGGATGHLHILINPTGHQLGATAAEAYATGYSILFDEHDQIIYVGGKPYKFKTLTSQEYTSIKNSVLDAAATGSLASQITNINNIIGNIEGPSGATTIEGALGELQDEIEALQTDVAGVSGALQGAISSLNTDIAAAASGKITSVNGLTGVTGAVVISGSDIEWKTGITGTSVADKFDAIDQSIDTITGALGDLSTQVSQFATGAALQFYGEDGTSPTSVIGVGTYYLKQGSREIAEFNIDKDSFVKNGEVVRGTLSGETWTASATGDYYIHLVIGTSDATEKDLYIPAESLVDGYTSGSGENDAIQVTVNNNTNKITATVKAGSITGTEIATGAISSYHIAANAVNTANIADDAVTADKIAIGVDTKTGVVTSGDAAATGAAEAKSGATASSYVAVVNMASVSTQDAQVSGVTVGTTYADAYGAAAAVLGNSGDATSAATVYGAKNYASGAVAEAKTDLIGAADAGADTNTIRGAKAYADNVAANAAGDVISWTIIDGDTSSQG